MLEIKKAVWTTFNNLKGNNFETLDQPSLPIWQKPLVGVAAGDDPYYDFLKQHIGPFHWSPLEVFEMKYEAVDAASLRVVSIVFPQTDETKASQRRAKVFPCDNWVVSRGEWEPLMQEFSRALVDQLEQVGIRAVSIDLQPEFRRETSDTLGIASVWSHRHSAYAAGLGTFSLSEGLITEKGKAVRMTSMIVEAPLPITARTYSSPYEWCLFYQDGSCGACIARCPANAISKAGHDKNICAEYEDIAIEKYWPDHIDKAGYIFGCGLCQAAVPCQDKRP